MTLTFGAGDKAGRDVTRLVDDKIDARERPAIEAWLADHPEVRREVMLQRSAARGLRFGGPQAPESLIVAIERCMSHRRRWQTLGRTPPRTRQISAVAALATVALVAGVLAISLAQPGAHRAPTVGLAAKLVFAPATDPAPAARSSRLLDVAYSGITFPNYAGQFDVVSTGRRIDRLAGRPALTVFYRLRDGARLSYTVYSGAPVALREARKTVVFRGVALRVAAVDSRLSVVTLVRHGHTCVLAAPAAAGVLLALAEAPLQSPPD
jgi:hypothetical protein